MASPTLLDFTQTITVAQGQSTSAAIDLGGGGSESANPAGYVLMGLIVPSALEATTARLSFLASDAIDGTFTAVKRNGTAVTLTIAANDYGLLDSTSQLWGVRYLKVVCETSAGVAVTQATASRTFKVIKGAF